MRTTISKEQAGEAVQSVNRMSERMLDALIGSGPANPLEHLIRAGMTEADALELRKHLNKASTQDGGKMMIHIIAHFAASCARNAVRITLD